MVGHATEKTEFDRIADEYAEMHAQSIAASGESPEYFARYKVVDVAEWLGSARSDVRRILDFGSGTGNTLPHLAQWFPQAMVVNADISRRCMEVSRSRFPDIASQYCEIGAQQLPFNAASFDLVFTACVFHHIPPDQHGNWLKELKRVTKPGGRLFLFEHNPLNPLTVAAVRSCPFDENAVLIGAGDMTQRITAAGWKAAEAVYRIFFPKPLAFARPMERWMRKLPLGAQYFVSAVNA
ncbi:malonyl-(acyl-carrier protein) O-methyltransferase [Novimethylophilus kurashikiensis]|uniref:Malonyl-(Acyl-carrier protein) O-methyltransferase n=1 Tax=Novimethylophilus kurashikiensis TaxID=1825523 RepID=A0A2R5FBD6_9PROT|nr:class I SAM-dependent methyltransferase [Novimethylophilus kurashikiensis]GBG14001.1 malonyl-(acyl-carrier protein) O-methyltransferase [Novimethylophilus kurashikiensis]